MEEVPFSLPSYLVNRAARAFGRIGEARLKPLGFGLGYMPVVLALRDGGSLAQNDLARFARIEQASMAQTLARMERDGLIRRDPDPADGRSSLVSLTPAAHERLPQVREVLADMNREALAGFTAHDAEAFVSMLASLVANLDEAEAGRQVGRARTRRYG